jgi:hypothetical protein
MNYIIEAILVGVYSLLVYIPIKFFSNNLCIVFFITGFLKHFLGYFFGIHSLYCKFHNLEIKKVQILKLFLESFLEGFLFLIGGLLLTKIKVKLKVIFIIGFILHIVFEMLGIHKSFINQRCLKN